MSQKQASNYFGIGFMTVKLKLRYYKIYQTCFKQTPCIKPILVKVSRVSA